jgi:hypothetical protein
MNGAQPERTGWRDARISKRHRDWGGTAAAVDIDFLLVEYNLAKPVALVEYKHPDAKPWNAAEPNYRALADLANNYTTNTTDGLPFLVATYWPDIWAFKVYPVNGTAQQHFDNGELLTEYEYVKRLYKLRRLALSKELELILHKELPEQHK